MAIGIAVRMGLHRDGYIGTFSAFNIELRRRVWWELCTLDVLTAISDGGDPTIVEKISFTSMPLNVDDDDLVAATEEASEGRTYRTGMTTSLIRYHLFHFAKAVLFSDEFTQFNSVVHTLHGLDNFSVALDRDHLAMLDTENDADAVALFMARAFMMKLRRKMNAALDSIGCEAILRDTTLLKDKRWACLFDVTAELDVRHRLVQR